MDPVFQRGIYDLKEFELASRKSNSRKNPVTRALIGMYFNEDTIVTERYEGDQSVEELDRIIPTYQSQAILKNSLGRGTITHIPESHGGAVKLAEDKTIRKHPRVTMQTIEDYARLKDESVRAVKLERMRLNEEAQKDADHKKRYTVAFEEDDWRPDEIYIVTKGQGNWSGRLIWRKLVDGEWKDINPEVVYVNEHPEEANKIFDSIKGKSHDDVSTSKRSTRKSTKKTTATKRPKSKKDTEKIDDYEPLVEENVIEVKELDDEDAKYAKMLDDLGNNKTDDYEFEE